MITQSLKNRGVSKLNFNVSFRHTDFLVLIVLEFFELASYSKRKKAIPFWICMKMDFQMITL